MIDVWPPIEGSARWLAGWFHRGLRWMRRRRIEGKEIGYCWGARRELELSLKRQSWPLPKVLSGIPEGLASVEFDLGQRFAPRVGSLRLRDENPKPTAL